MAKYKTFFVTHKSIEARTLAIQLMREHGLLDWQFAFNQRLRGLGLCIFKRSGVPGRIELSVHHTERSSLEEVRDTILHEIAHAIAGAAAGHGPIWKEVCRRIGARPVRCSTAEMPRGRWVTTCPCCGSIYHRHRRPKNPTGYHCVRCGPAKGSLTWSLGLTAQAG